MRLTLIKFNFILREFVSSAHTGNVCPLEEREREFESRCCLREREHKKLELTWREIERKET